MAPRVLTLMLLTASLLLAGCTGGEADANNTTTDQPPVDIPAEPTPVSATVTYTGFYGAPAGNEYTASISVPQGSRLTVTFDNQDQNTVVSHDWYLEALDIGTEVIGSGESTEVTFLVDLEPGDYVYYCTIGDGSHRENGMEGTLTVTAA